MDVYRLRHEAVRQDRSEVVLVASTICARACRAWRPIEEPCHSWAGALRQLRRLIRRISSSAGQMANVQPAQPPRPPANFGYPIVIKQPFPGIRPSSRLLPPGRSRCASAKLLLRGWEWCRCRAARGRETGCDVPRGEIVVLPTRRRKNGFGFASAGSGQRFAQSERTITTEPAGILPFRFSQLSISERRR